AHKLEWACWMSDMWESLPIGIITSPMVAAKVGDPPERRGHAPHEPPGRAERAPGDEPPDTQAYYDEFSKRYEKHRAPNDPSGYHALVDDLEIDFVSRFAAGGDILEVGCGTGLLLERLAAIGRSAAGIDLSPGMLAKA